MIAVRARCGECFVDLGTFFIGGTSREDETPSCSDHPTVNPLVSTDPETVRFGWDEETDPANLTLEEIFGVDPRDFGFDV